MILLKNAVDATGLTESQIAEIRRAMPDSPVKKLIAYDLQSALQIRYVNHPTTIEGIWKEEGIREGLEIAIGILDKKK